MAFYYPLQKRLKALLLIPGFRKLLDHEFTRPRNANIMSDVYDTPAWQSFMRPPTQPCSRIGLQGCSDGFQAFNYGSLSLTPVECSIFSLPPALRFKPEFMLLLMLLPTNVKGFATKKYFDFAADYELNILFYRGNCSQFLLIHNTYAVCFRNTYTGVSGIKVKLFSISEDTIGRHSLLGLQSTMGLESACPVCFHKWTPGLTGTQCCFGGYRTLLPLGSRGRQARVQDGGNTYEYADVEERPTPQLRTTRLARECLAVVETIGVKACKGHKYAPLIAAWPGIDWYRISPGELMHDTKILVEMIVKTLVGKVSNSGFYANWSYDSTHRRENQMRNIFESTWPGNDGPLPWRLTKDERLFLDEHTLLARTNRKTLL